MLNGVPLTSIFLKIVFKINPMSYLLYQILRTKMRFREVRNFPKVTQHCSTRPRDLNTDSSASRVRALNLNTVKCFGNSVEGKGMVMRVKKHHSWSEVGFENVS